MNLTLGLDLGQQRDYSALVITERVHQFITSSTYPDVILTHENSFELGPHEDPPVQDAYQVRHLQRWRLGTPPTSVVEDIAELMGRPELEESLLVFDRTGIGGVYADLFFREWREGRLGSTRAALYPQGVTFVAGFALHGAAEGYLGGKTAHKGDVINRMTMLLNTGRLILPPGLAGGADLEKELRAYTVKRNVRTGYEHTEAKRESDHDDLVVALALSVWVKNFYGPEPRYVDARTGDLREKAEGYRAYTNAT